MAPLLEPRRWRNKGGSTAENQMPVLESSFKNVGATIRGAETRDCEQGVTVVSGAFGDVLHHFPQKVVAELVKKGGLQLLLLTLLLLLLLLLLLPKHQSASP